MRISDKDIFNQYSRIFPHRDHSGAGNENRLAQSQNSFVFKGRNMRRFYDLFLFRTGNGRFDKGRKGAYCSAVRDSERGVRNGRSIRGTGNHPEGMISGGEISDAFT